MGPHVWWFIMDIVRSCASSLPLLSKQPPCSLSNSEHSNAHCEPRCACEIRARCLCLGLSERDFGSTFSTVLAMPCPAKPRGYVCNAGFDADLVPGPLGLCKLVIIAEASFAFAYTLIREVVSPHGGALGTSSSRHCKALLNGQNTDLLYKAD